jgi:plastocyanin
MKSTKNLFGLIGLTAGVAAFLTAIPSFAGSITVTVGTGGALVFTPSTATVPVNTSVIWSWSGNFHSTTSGNSGTPNGLWDSGVHNPPNFFTNTFNSAGTFPYYCSIHFSEGMLGKIIVTNAAVPPVPPIVTITSPTSGVVLSAPASLTLAADASVTNGNITRVQFFQGANSLGSVAAPPYTLAVNNLSAAAYTFSAVATADSGLTATNSVSVSVINPSPLSISSPVFSAPRQFQFTYASDIGLTYVVQVSTNFASGWTSIDTNTATANPTTFTDSNAASADAFYQVLRLPNP